MRPTDRPIGLGDTGRSLKIPEIPGVLLSLPAGQSTGIGYFNSFGHPAEMQKDLYTKIPVEYMFPSMHDLT